MNISKVVYISDVSICRVSRPSVRPNGDGNGDDLYTLGGLVMMI